MQHDPPGARRTPPRAVKRRLVACLVSFALLASDTRAQDASDTAQEARPAAADAWLRVTRCSDDFPVLLTRVAFRDDVGLAVGGNPERGEPSVVLRSTDRGGSWSRRPTPTDVRLYGVAFADDRVALAVGLDGVVLRSADAGETWQRVALDSGSWLSDVAFATPDVGVVVGSDEGAAEVWRTTDGGRRFARVDLPSGSGGLRSVALQGSLGLAVGDQGRILRSDDGGATWTQVESGSREWLRSVRRGGDGTWRIAGTRDTLLASRDEGATWRAATAPSAGKLNDAWFADAHHGLVLTMDRGIQRTRDGGATWDLAHDTAGSAVTCVVPLGPGQAYAVGDGQLLRLEFARVDDARPRDPR